jgi:type I restriction enzyme, S subunit
MTAIDQHGWMRKPLGEVASVVSGYAFKSSEFREIGIPVVKIKNVRVGYVDLTEVDRIDEKFLGIPERYHVSAGDVLISLTGSHISQPNSVVGRVARHSTGLPKCLLNQRVGKVIIKHHDVCDLGFLFYALSEQETVRAIALKAHGAANQANVSPTQVESVEIPLPPLPVQRRIAGILSAYDELIENSQRRIKILESMARALYREWFVHFRFPGHEKLPRVASPLGDIPQGWEVKEMREVADVIDCLHSKKPGECAEGPGILLHLNNIGEGGKLDMREQFRISAEDYQLWTSRIELRSGDCVVTNVGRVGAVAQIPEGFKAAPGRNMTGIRVRTGITPTYLIEYLLSSYMESEVAKKKDLGTIMDGLNVKGIVRLNVPCPPFEVMQKFESIARPSRQRIELLVKQVENLRRTRDLLLPRLLSGQIDVEVRLSHESPSLNRNDRDVHPSASC